MFEKYELANIMLINIVYLTDITNFVCPFSRLFALSKTIIIIGTYFWLRDPNEIYFLKQKVLRKYGKEDILPFLGEYEL